MSAITRISKPAVSIGKIALAVWLLCSGWANAADQSLAVTRKSLEQGTPTTIVCLGDSVTGVYYHTGGLRAYTDMLGIALQRHYPGAKLTMINAGISGNTTREGLDRLERDVLKHKPTLVTIMFGLNDLVRVPLEQYRVNLRELTARCQAAGAEVLLATPNAVIDSSGRPISRLEEYCQAMRDTARESNVPVADCYAELKQDRERDYRPWRLTMSDAIHPNMDGHQRIAEILARSIGVPSVSLADVAPQDPRLARVAQRLRDKQPIRVLAMPPYDQWIEPALKAIDSSAQVGVTTWETKDVDLATLEQSAQKQVRAFKPDLVVIAVPRSAVPASWTTDDWEAFAHHYTWVLNWSLSFGVREWDTLIVHPNVSQPEDTSVDPWDSLIRQIVGAQDLPLIDRVAGDSRPAREIFTTAVRVE